MLAGRGSRVGRDFLGANAALPLAAFGGDSDQSTTHIHLFITRSTVQYCLETQVEVFNPEEATYKLWAT
jgi:hypothetical protein